MLLKVLNPCDFKTRTMQESKILCLEDVSEVLLLQSDRSNLALANKIKNLSSIFTIQGKKLNLMLTEARFQIG
jgi:hypothetical protein